MGMLSQKEQDAIDNLKKKFSELLSSPEVAYDVASSLLDDLVDEMILGVAFEVHRSATLGLLEPENDLSGEDSSKFQIVEVPDLDIFGQPFVVKKFQDCICPSCNRALAASRFAPHLEKCMGMGRNSSRIASRRIANNSKESSNLGSEDEDDVEWSLTSDKRRKKRDRSNGCSKRPSKSHKSERRNGNGDPVAAAVALVGATISIGEGPSTSPGPGVMLMAAATGVLTPGVPVTTGAAPATGVGMIGVTLPTDINSTTSAMLEKMRPDDRRTLLSQICGVVSEHTRKLCTRSLRCPQHTDEQKRALRASLTLVDDTSFQAEIQVNVESLGLESDDVLSGLGVGGLGGLGGLGPLGGLGSLSTLSGRSNSWEAERSNTSSPADSGSVGSSSSSKKREKASPAKVSNHKKKTSKHSSSLE